MTIAPATALAVVQPTLPGCSGASDFTIVTPGAGGIGTNLSCVSLIQSLTGGPSVMSKPDCTIGNQPFIIPRSDQPDASGTYEPVTGSIWREGYGGGSLSPIVTGIAGSSASGTGDIITEWTDRIANAMLQYSTNPSGFGVGANTKAFIWKDAAGDVVPPDITLAALGFSYDEKSGSWYLDAGTDIQKRVDTIQNQTWDAFHPGYYGTPAPVVHGSLSSGAAALSPENANVVTVNAAFNSGTVDQGAILAFLNARTAANTPGFSWGNWASKLIPLFGVSGGTAAAEWGVATPTPLGNNQAGIYNVTITYTKYTRQTHSSPAPTPAPICYSYGCTYPTPDPNATPVITYTWSGTSQTHTMAATDTSWAAPGPNSPPAAGKGDVYYGGFKISFDLRIPNRTRIVSSQAAAQAKLDSFIKGQLATSPGNYYWLPVFMAPLAGSASVCVNDTFKFLDGVTVGHLNATPGNCHLSRVSYQAQYASEIDAGSASERKACYIGWQSFITPLPNLSMSDLQNINWNAMVMKADPVVPIVNQKTLISIDPSTLVTNPLSPMGQNSDTTWPKFADYWMQWNITQPAISIAVGDGTHGVLKDSSGNVVPQIIVARDPSKPDGGYNGIAITFARTPLSVMQDAACKTALSSGGLDALEAKCGVRVVDTGGGRIEPVFAVTIRTWFTGEYVYKGSGYRGFFNPWWTGRQGSQTPVYVCQNTYHWSDGAFAAAGISNTPWGRIATTFDGVSARGTVDAQNQSGSGLSAAWPGNTVFSSSTPLGDAGTPIPPTPMSCSGSVTGVSNVGSYVYEPYTTLYMPVVQVQAVGQ